MSSRQTCIFVLGMHRSGTSAFTGVLNLIGLELGSETTPPSSLENPKGFFENVKIQNFNKKILRENYSSWDDPFFNIKQINQLEYIQEAKDLLEEEFQYFNTFVIKDPRICILFPIWEKACSELNIDIKIIIPYRNPIEVANSLKKRDSLSIEKGMLLWVSHFLFAEKYSRDYLRIFVSFNDLIHHTFDTITRIANSLQIDFSQLQEPHCQDEIKKFLEPSLKHHNISHNNWSTHTPTIIQDIFKLEDQFNSVSLIRKFDKLYQRFFTNKELFYNQDIKNEFNVLRNRITNQDIELTRANTDIKELTSYRNDFMILKERVSVQDRELKEGQETLKTFRERVSVQDRELREAQEALRVLRERVSNQDKELEYKNSKLVDKNKTLQATIDELNSCSIKFNRQLNIQKEEYNAMVKTVSQQTKELDRLRSRITNQDKEISRKNRELLQQTRLSTLYIEELKDEISSIYMSRSWKVTRWVRKVKNMLRKAK
jgi:hypothetical protein